MRVHTIAAGVLALAALRCGSEGSPPAGASASGTAAATASASARAPAVATASASATATGSSVASTPPAEARQLYYERKIEKADLEGRTLQELTLMRNWIYARAGNPFRKPWLDEFFKAQAWYKPGDKWDESKITPLDRQNARAIVDHEAAITTEDLERRKNEVLERKKAGTASKADEIELMLLSQRLGTWLGEGEAPAALLADPTRLDKLLTVDQLNELSRRDLRILRNTIYARRGRPFESEVVKEYFKSAKWYKPTANYDDGMLNEVDRKNIAIVKSVEDSLGGPMHENPDYGKVGWFVMA